MTPELIQFAIGIVCGGFGWYLRHRQAAGQAEPEILQLVQLLAERRKQRQAHGLLQELAADQPVPAVPPKA